MDLFGLGSIINAGIGLGTNIYNAKQQKELNEKQLALSREQFEYNKQLQQKIFEREDNAVQRKSEDLLKAGINPMLAGNTGGASAGAIVGSSAMSAGNAAPQMNAEAMKVGNILNGIYDAMSAKQNLQMSQVQIDKLKSDILTDAQRRTNMQSENLKTIQDTDTSKATAERTRQETQNLQTTQDKIRKETEELTYNLDLSKNQRIRTNDNKMGIYNSVEAFSNMLNNEMSKAFGPVLGGLTKPFKKAFDYLWGKK